MDGLIMAAVKLNCSYLYWFMIRAKSQIKNSFKMHRTLAEVIKSLIGGLRCTLF